MILVIVLENGDLRPQGRSFPSYDAFRAAVKKAPGDFEPNTTYALITPSKTVHTTPQTVMRFDLQEGTIPGADAPKPRAPRKATGSTGSPPAEMKEQK